MPIAREISDKAVGSSKQQHPYRAAFDLAMFLLVFAVCALCVPYLNPQLRKAHGFRALLVAAAYQFCADGLVPLTLMVIRRESFADYGYTRRRIGMSLLLGCLLATFYDAGMSLHAHMLLWVPLRSQPAVRISLASAWPLTVFGIAITVLLWGFLEGFVGVYLATKVNVVCKHPGTGWLTPGVIAFALLNGGIHMIVGQGFEGFLTSFASGYAIAVVPAVTGNAWGGSLVQTLTNAIASLSARR